MSAQLILPRMLRGLAVMAMVATAAVGFSSSASAFVVNPTAYIDEEPLVNSVNAGDIVHFEAMAHYSTSGPLLNPGWLWQVSVDRGVSWGPANDPSVTVGTCVNTVTSGGQCSTLSFPAKASYSHLRFRAVYGMLADGTWITATTSQAILFVNTGERVVHITSEPTSVTVPAGQPASLTATATGNPAPVVQWQVANSNGDWVNVAEPTARSPHLVIPSADVQPYAVYRAVFLIWLAAGTPDQWPSYDVTNIATITRS